MLYQLVIGLFVAVNSQVTSGPFACPDPAAPTSNCDCTYGTCTFAGDPHQTTFDGFHYHFQGDVASNEGQYRYISSCASNEARVPFQLIAEHDGCNPTPWNLDVRCVSRVIVRLYSATTSPGTFAEELTINSGWSVDTQTSGTLTTSTTLGYGTFPQGYYVLDVPNRRLEVYTGNLCPGKPDLIVEDISGSGNLRNMRVQLNEFYQGAVCGLCGYWNGDSSDDFLRPAAFATSPYNLCLYQTQPLNLGMNYNPVEASNVNIFGENWRDIDVGIRRLQGIPNRAQDLQIEQPVDNKRREKALNIAREIFPDGEDRNKFFFDDCADDAQFVCQEVNEECVRVQCLPLLGLGDTGKSAC